MIVSAYVSYIYIYIYIHTYIHIYIYIYRRRLRQRHTRPRRWRSRWRGRSTWCPRRLFCVDCCHVVITVSGFGYSSEVFMCFSLNIEMNNPMKDKRACCASQRWNTHPQYVASSLLDWLICLEADGEAAVHGVLEVFVLFSPFTWTATAHTHESKGTAHLQSLVLDKQC